jgi:hypothetical protein
MHITGPSSHLPLTPVRPPSGAAAATPAPGSPPAPSAKAAATAHDIPAGSDPALWSILTSEERAFFHQQAALGPLTYGRARPTATAAEAPIGQRIDVRA